MPALSLPGFRPSFIRLAIVCAPASLLLLGACGLDGHWEEDPDNGGPEETEALILGHVFDASTGDEVTGMGMPGVSVVCDCGPVVETDEDGAFSFFVPKGDHVITAWKEGFIEASEAVSVNAGGEALIAIGLTPEEEPALVSVIDHSFLIGYFGGDDVDPSTFEDDVAGFQAYLDAVGVTYFSALEFVTPHNGSAAESCDYEILLPEREWWRKAGALGLLADQLRTLVNEPVYLRNWWRPPCYNDLVGGAAGSDHVDADAIDLDFSGPRSRADAQLYLCETYWKEDLLGSDEIEPGSDLDPRLNLSVGLGGESIHVGLLSRNGRRFWKYSSYAEVEGSGDCW